MKENIKYFVIQLFFSFMLISIVYAEPEPTDSNIQEDNASSETPLDSDGPKTTNSEEKNTTPKTAENNLDTTENKDLI